MDRMGYYRTRRAVNHLNTEFVGAKSCMVAPKDGEFKVVATFKKDAPAEKEAAEKEAE